MNFVCTSDKKPESEEKNVVINLLVFQESGDTKILEPSVNKAEIRVENVSHNDTPYQLVYLSETVNKTTLKSKNLKKKIGRSSEHKSKAALYKHKKKLNVGWLHCPKEGKKFTQVRAINGGGLKFLELSKDDRPNLEEFLKLAKELFFQHKNMTPYGPMSEMNFYIGNFDGQKISQFVNNNGEMCDIWEYMQSRGLSPSRMNFYLLSQSKDEIIDKEVSLTNETNVQVEINEKTEQEVKKNEENEYFVLVPNTLHVKFMINFGKFDDNNDHIINMILNSKSSCFTDAVARGLVSTDMEIDQFHPSQVGYEIIQIQLGEKVYFKVDYEQECKKLSFLSCQTDNFEPHSIIHQPEDLLGVDDDGSLATALIASCDDDCCPIVTWFCNGEVFAKGEKLYFITISKSASYQCQIKCNEMKNEIMSNVLTVFK